MPVPSDAPRATEAMDPADRLDFTANMAPLLDVGEAVASVTLAPAVDAAGLGLQVESAAPYAPSAPAANQIKFWLSVNSAQWSAADFQGQGVDCAVEITVITNATPARRIQRSMVVTLRQR